MREILLQSLLRLGRQLGLVLWLLVLLPAVLLLSVNTDPGRRLLAWGIGELSGGQVRLDGLSGNLPAAPRLQRLELRDGQGVWLVIEEAALDLDMRALAGAEIAIDWLSARSVRLQRMPDAGVGGAPVRALPRIRLRSLAVEDLRLGQAFPGAPPLMVEGQGSFGGPGLLGLQAQILALGRSDRYRVDFQAEPDGLRLDLDFLEGPGGLLPALAHRLGWSLPAGLADWRFQAHGAGPSSALDLEASVEAGALRASANGLLDLETRSATRLHLEARVPALDPTAGWPVAWQGLALSGELAGPLNAPEGVASLVMNGLSGGGLGLDRLTLEARGGAERLRLEGELQGLRAPFALPESARREPLRIAGEVNPKAPSLPFSLDLAHPLLALEASGTLGPPAGRAHLELPDLDSLAALAGLDLVGSAHLDASADLEPEPRLEASAGIVLTRAPPPLPRLLGPEARLALAAQREAGAWRIVAAEIAGAGIRATAEGTVSPKALALGWTLELPDLATLGAGWTGRLTAQGGLSGPPRAPDLVADLSGEAAYGRLGAGRMDGRVSAGMAEPAAVLDLGGHWAGQPLRLELQAGREPAGDLRIALKDARWASVTASGDLRHRPGSGLPQGELRLDGERLADLAPLLVPLGLAADPALDGRLGARLRLEGDELRLDALGDGLVLPGSVRIGALALDAVARDPWGTAEAQGQLRLTGLALGSATVDLSLGARGPLRDLALTADGAIAMPAGQTLLALAGRLDAAEPQLTLERLEARMPERTLRLREPARIQIAEGLPVDRLRLGLGEGTLELSGRLLPPLATEARLLGFPLEVATLVAPDLPLAGTLSGEAQLAGPIEALAGSLRLRAEGLRLARGTARGLPPAELRLTADLGPAGTRIDASAAAGKGTRLGLQGRLGGQLPFAPTSLDLQADGRLDLALLDPLLTGAGRQAAGQAQLDSRVTGTPTAPRLTGGVRLTDGAFWDRNLGLVLTQIQGNLALAGDTLRFEGLTAQAGTGRLDLAGAVGALAPGIPVDLRLTAEDASPLQIDRLRVQGSGDVRLTGEVLKRLEAAGTLRLKQVEILLPERLPEGVVTLPVREVGRRRAGDPSVPTRPVWRPDLGLDLRVAAPRSVLVRGRGVDAVLGGEVRVQGTLADPALSGGFDLLRGKYELVGQTLRFSRGRLGFDGAAGLNPNLDLESRVSVAGSTAILAVEGTAQAPRITLRGEPEMPQDEVLSRLLFGVAGGRLSPWQATRLGIAAASLAGIEVGDFRLLERLGDGLGLSRLGLGTDRQGNANIEGGRQLSERFHLGARQGTRAGEPQGVLQIEVSPRIQLEADIGPIGGTRAGAAFELEY